MSRNEEKNWSADLRRISLWLQMGNIDIAKKFIDRGKKMYAMGRDVGKRKWTWWMSEIENSDRLFAAERALTWSLLLK